MGDRRRRMLSADGGAWPSDHIARARAMVGSRYRRVGHAWRGSTVQVCPHSMHRKRRTFRVMSRGGASKERMPKNWRARVPWPHRFRPSPTGREGALHQGHLLGRSLSTEGQQEIHALTSTSLIWTFGVLVGIAKRARREGRIFGQSGPSRHPFLGADGGADTRLQVDRLPSHSLPGQFHDGDGRHGPRR